MSYSTQHSQPWCSEFSSSCIHHNAWQLGTWTWLPHCPTDSEELIWHVIFGAAPVLPRREDDSTLSAILRFTLDDVTSLPLPDHSMLLHWHSPRKKKKEWWVAQSYMEYIMQSFNIQDFSRSFTFRRCFALFRRCFAVIITLVAGFGGCLHWRLPIDLVSHLVCHAWCHGMPWPWLVSLGNFGKLVWSFHVVSLVLMSLLGGFEEGKMDYGHLWISNW